MNLKEFIDRTGIGDYELARQIGCSHTQIWRIKNRFAEPTLALALALHRFSGGAIDLRSMVLIDRYPIPIPTTTVHIQDD